MYQTLYRKYRPINFDEVVGQDVIIKTLKNEIKINKLNHAYLFTGPRGTGKTSIAKILAKTINCTNLIDYKPCDTCVNCTQIINKKNTDIIEIDAASNNGVDEIRELKSKVNLVPSSGKYKIYIIDEVHMLTIGAFNALLKTLEEPPAHIIFILATTDPHKIPMTILSRCQRFDFKKISLKHLEQRLNKVIELEKLEIDPTAIKEIVNLADGGMRDALSILDQVIAYSDGKITLDDVHEVNGTLSQNDMEKFLYCIVKNDLIGLLNHLDIISNNGKNLVKFTEEFILLLRDILICKAAPTYFENNNNSNSIKSISQEIKQDDLISMIAEFNKTLNEMHYSNNPKLLLELLFINLIKSEEKILPAAELTSPSKIKKENIIKQSVIDIPSDIQQDKSELVVENNNTKELTEGKTNLENLNEIVNVRINNALAGFTKTEIIKAKEKLEIIQTLLIDEKCSKYISMLLDSNLKIAGNDYLVYVCKNKNLANIFNANILELEQILIKKLGLYYKLIAIDTELWNQVKEEYNSKTKQYILKEETIDLKEIFPKNKKNKEDKIKDLFGEIVEYEEEK